MQSVSPSTGFQPDQGAGGGTGNSPRSSEVDSSGSLPLLEVDINITPTHTERIQIHSGDVIEGDNGIARKFCQTHGLGDVMERQLVRVLTEQMEEAREQAAIE